MTAPLSVRWDFPAIGTRWRIDTAEPLEPAVQARVRETVDRFDAAWSRFRPDSVVSTLAARGGFVPAPADAEAMLDLYAALSSATGGAVNPLIGDALARRGYDAAISLRDGGAQAAPVDWTDLLFWHGDTLEVRGGGLIDVGALGKGRLVDLVGDVLAEASLSPATVDASGDIRVRGAAERIALEHPYDPTRAIGVWQVADAALCASATNRRRWGDGLHHVLDARTGEPVRTIVATWAVASDAMTADAAATALFFDGGDHFAAEYGAHWVRMLSDGRVEWSPDCEAELFT